MNNDQISLFRKEILNREQIAIKVFVIFTWVVWLLVVLKFITQGKIVVPAGLWSNYLIILTAYVLTKEVSRWRLKVVRHRHGDWFVGLWITTGIIVWIIIGFDSYIGKDLACPYELNWLVGQIIIYYIGSDYSKRAFYKSIEKEDSGESKPERDNK